MAQGRHRIWLLLLLLPATPQAVSIPEICNTASCNFTWLEGQLDRTLGLAAGDGAAWPGAAFASALVSLNLRLRQQLLLASRCAQRWLARPPGSGCYDICCPEASLGGLAPALRALKADVKLSFTLISAQHAAPAEYQSAAFDILNVYSGAFFDYIRQLAAAESGQARVELATFAAFYARLRPLLPAVAAAACSTGDSNATVTGGLSNLGGTGECRRRGQVWRNAVGVALQNLVMCEVAAVGDEAAEAAWQAYATVADCVTQLVLACERAAIRDGNGSDGAGGGPASATVAGLRDADIALAVLIPVLLVLLAAAVAFAVRSSRRRRRQERRQRQQVPNSQRSPSSTAPTDSGDDGELGETRIPHQQRRHCPVEAGGGAAPDLLYSESAAMVPAADTRYIDDPDVV